MKFVAFYGTLTRAFDVQRRLGLASELGFVSACSIPGRLYDLGDYPGLVAARGAVRGEVFELLGSRTLERLDDFEGYDSAEPQASEYLRRSIRLIEPNLDAWVYLYNRPVEERSLIASGEWAFDDRRAAAILTRITSAQERSLKGRPADSRRR